ncbi:MAG: AlpA family phage regulatory protein [Hyphomicrobiales bacterium]
MSNEAQKQIETIRESARAIGVSYSTLRRMIAAGDFPKPIQISRRRKGILISKRNAWLEKKASQDV